MDLGKPIRPQKIEKENWREKDSYKNVKIAERQGSNQAHEA